MAYKADIQLSVKCLRELRSLNIHLDRNAKAVDRSIEKIMKYNSVTRSHFVPTLNNLSSALAKAQANFDKANISTVQGIKAAENLAKNQINSQLDSVVKINAGLGGQQESSSNQTERKENETTAGYISDLNTVLTGDVATAKQTLQGLIETRNVQNKANNQPTIDGFDMTEDYIIFYMSDGNNIRREVESGG